MDLNLYNVSPFRSKTKSKVVTMPFTYNSIFDGPNVITKKDLCELLNLDTSRPNLAFSPAEINKAYRVRALRFHPDGQQARYEQPIPVPACNTLIRDIKLARDYMLAGEDNIPGKAFKENLAQFEPSDWISTLTDMLKATKNGSVTLTQTVSWLYFFSSSLLVTIPLSTYSDGQLNFRYINTFSKQLAAIRPFLKDIDGSSVAVFLLILRDYMNSAEQINTEEILARIKEISPELLDSIAEQKKLDALLLAIAEAGQELKLTLTDEFINQLQYIIGFWPQLIANMPTWNNIMNVFFISTLFTATSLPKFFNALKVIAEIIIQQKGWIPFLLTAVPLLLLSTFMLPVNLAVQLGLPLAWISLKATYQILTNGFLVLFSGVNLLLSLLPNSNNSTTNAAFSLFEGSFNLIVRLSLNIAIETLDSVIFVLSNKSPLSSLQTSLNTGFDDMLDSLRPEIKPTEQLDHENETRALVPIKGQTEIPKMQFQEPAQQFGFFPNSKLFNDEDIWLNNLLKDISAAERTESEMANNVTAQ